MNQDILTADPLALDAARRGGDAEYDAERDLLANSSPPNPIHTRVTGRAHPIRDSLAYALLLWELDAAGDTEVDGEPRAARAARVLDAVLALQDADEDSDTYGLWAYYAEEPLSQMSPPDWNWADFLGEFLCLLLFRHGERLEPALRERAGTAVRRAAASIIRRDVDLDYTNIAVKGAFVTLAAGQLLDDEDLEEYGRTRLRRLHALLTRSRSFAEFNSPSYWAVVMQAFTGIRQYIHDDDAVAQAGDIERIAWEHFLARWHPATGQLTGPMARCYSTDLRRKPSALLIVQRVAGDTWPIFDADTRPADVHSVHDAVLDLRIPDDLRPLLDRPAAEPTVREVFTDTHYIPGQVAGVSAAAAEGHETVILPTVGTSWHEGAATLGSVNFGDTWLQRRPLLGYWAEPGDDPADPDTVARFVSVEVLRDGHGFAGGSFRAEQDGSDVLWSIALATPSGDAHIHLDAIQPGEAVATSSLLVRFSVRGLDDAEVRADGTPLDGERRGVRRVDVRTRTATVEWILADALFDGAERTARVTPVDGGIDIDVAWLEAGTPQELVVSALSETFATGMLRLRNGELAPADVTAERGDGSLRLRRVLPDREALALTAPTRPGSRLDHARIVAASLSA
ncbi:hypothetical protein [Microbacterium sp.]|uniref:hypothetical protein n=1 Tax=Microbacterium sp. TaxID=51671 RepID=UPI00333EF859